MSSGAFEMLVGGCLILFALVALAVLVLLYEIQRDITYIKYPFLDTDSEPNGLLKEAENDK